MAEKTHKGQPGLQDGRPLPMKSRRKTKADVKDPLTLCRKVGGEEEGDGGTKKSLFLKHFRSKKEQKY